MGTKIKVSAAVLVAAAGVYFVVRTPQAESPRVASVEPLAEDADLADQEGVELLPVTEGSVPDSIAGPVRRSTVAKDPPAEVAATLGTNVLRVVIDGITEEDARLARVTVAASDERGKRIAGVGRSWPCQGLTSEFDLDPLHANVAERDLRVGSMLVHVDHPMHLLEHFWLSPSDAVEVESGQTVYEVRVTLTGTVFWPELTLAVRDARTGAHLENVELHCIGTEYMGLLRQPGPGQPYSALGRGLSSPIVLMGGHKAEELDRVGAVALRLVAGEPPQTIKLAGRANTDRGVVVYARAPGYEWGRLVIDFSSGGERELLLGQGAALGVRVANVQLERYAALGTEAKLYVYQPGWGVGQVWVQPLDETLETEGLRLEGVEPGELAVAVELGVIGQWSRKRTVLAREELSLAAGETRELVLALSDPPAPPERVTLGGVVSFPAPTASWGEERVRLQLYQADWGYGDADAELSLAEMVRVDGELPTWAFQLEDIPVGTCQIHLLPFLKSWMIDVPAGGREDVALVIPELAEVRVETVDAQTGERIPLEQLRYIYKEDLPGRVHQIWSDQIWAGFDGEPGLFRVWTAPGAAYVGTWKIPSELGYGQSGKDLELVPGLQSVRLELTPPYTIRFELSVDGAALPYDDGIYRGLGQGIRGVDHDGRASYVSRRVAAVTAPGVYEISFEGVGADRFLPIAPRQVVVREGETAEVIVELYLK